MERKWMREKDRWRVIDLRFYSWLGSDRSRWTEITCGEKLPEEEGIQV
jgi:hypothetical protein